MTNEEKQAAEIKKCADFHALGKRDALAEVLMLVRLHGEVKALRGIADALIKSDPVYHNPHAVWYLKNHLE